MSKSNGHGGRRRGAGRPGKPIEDHIREGTYRRDRHGSLPKSGVMSRDRNDTSGSLRDLMEDRQRKRRDEELQRKYGDDIPAEELADDETGDEEERPVISAPEHLSQSAASWFEHVNPFFLVAFPGESVMCVELLVRAAELIDVMDKARAVISAEGLKVETKTTQKPRPEWSVYREALAEFRCITEDLGILPIDR